MEKIKIFKDGAVIEVAPDTLRRYSKPEPTITSLTAYAADRRWRAEVGGIAVKIGEETLQLPTARGDNRATLSSTYTAIRDGLRLDGASFKFRDGLRSVSNDDMMTAYLAAMAHVQASFDAEGDVVMQINNVTITTTEQIDAYPWPTCPSDRLSSR